MARLATNRSAGMAPQDSLWECSWFLPATGTFRAESLKVPDRSPCPSPVALGVLGLPSEKYVFFKVASSSTLWHLPC